MFGLSGWYWLRSMERKKRKEEICEDMVICSLAKGALEIGVLNVVLVSSVSWNPAAV